MSQRFAPEVHAFIRENVSGRTAEELASMTNAVFGTDFTKLSMKSYKHNHHLKSGTPGGKPKGSYTEVYPEHIVRYIADNHHGIGPKTMAQLLNETFGTAYTHCQLKGYYANHDLNSGLTGRFEKGHIPPNKGRKGYCAPGAEKGHFKTGHTPHNKTPVGTVRVKSDGYLWQKIGEGSREWRQLSHILWEQANGPIPEGCRLIYKDGNKLNCVLDNLALVTLEENAVMNCAGLRSEVPRHTEIGILIAKVKIAATKRKKKVGAVR